MSRRFCVALAFVLAVQSGGSVAFAVGCRYPLFHGHDSYFICPDGGAIGSFAYQLSDPDGVNTGTSDIMCEAQVLPFCLSSLSGTVGDDQVTIETVWGNPGSIGCPYQDGVAHRIALVTAGGSSTGGQSLLVSLSGANFDIYYLVEAAHPYDPIKDFSAPLSCGRTVEVTDAQPGIMALQFFPVPIHTDCDPGTAGDFLSICSGPLTPVLETGPVYTLVAPCGTHVDLRRSLWTPTGVTPDASGRAVLSLPAPAEGDCRLVGATTLFDGVESPAITAFVAGADCVVRDGVPSSTCLSQDIVDITVENSSPVGRGLGTLRWRTTAERDLLGFNVVTQDPSGRRSVVNAALIPCEQCMGGLSAAYTYLVPKHKSGESFFVEAVHAYGATQVFGPSTRER